MKKLLLILYTLSVFFCANWAYADVSINEIMYDLSGTDTDHEWVELYNSGEEVDLADWKFNDGSNHTLNDPPTNGGQGSLIIGDGEYLVLTGDAEVFLLDHPGYQGTVIDTVMSLANTEDTVSILDSDGIPRDTVTYTTSQGGAGDGNSLNLINGAWAGASPTPGQANTVIGGGSSTGEESGDLTNTTVIYKKTVSILVTEPFIVGTPIHFTPLALNENKEAITHGLFSWNMGDGTVRKTETPESFDYTYQYPGDYVVYLIYSPSPYVPTPEDISTREELQVIPASLVISTVFGDGGVTLENQSVAEINLNNWSLKQGTQTFIFPNNTFLLPDHSLTFSGKLLGFSQAIETHLYDPSGKEVSLWRTPSSTKPISKNVYTAPKIETAVSEITPLPLTANILDAPREHTKSYLSVILWVALILFAAAVIIAIRKYKKEESEITKEVDEYTIS